MEKTLENLQNFADKEIKKVGFELMNAIGESVKYNASNKRLPKGESVFVFGTQICISEQKRTGVNLTGIETDQFLEEWAGSAMRVLAKEIENSVQDVLVAGSDIALLAVGLSPVPRGGDSAREHFIVEDPETQIAFEFRLYPQYRQNNLEVSAAWGVGTP